MTLFPFSAVVGQDELKLALLLNALDPSLGGVLLRGQKGSAKTTLARALASLLPGQAPFVELPVGATEDRLVGTIDLGAALTGGERRFQPGLLAAAHGGVLYVDEVNLLPDHLVDVLLDVAASGVNLVEREGVSHRHPSRFVLIGSMNPEEGDLRPQLLDRFGLAVDVIAPVDPEERAEAVSRRLAFDAAPAAFSDKWAAADDDLRHHLATARPADLPADLITTVSRLCASVGAEGLRADLTICRAAAAAAGWAGRLVATLDDVRHVAPLALAHRRRRNPLDRSGIDRDELDQALDDAAGQKGEAGPPIEADNHRPDSDRPPDGGAVADAGGEAPGGEGQPSPSELPAAGGAGDERSRSPEGGLQPQDKQPSPGGQADQRPPVSPGLPKKVLPLAARPARASSGNALPSTGRRTTVEGPRGRLVADRPVADGPVGSLAIGATVTAAAARRQADPDGPLVQRSDLREAVRQQKTGNLIVLVVDASGSMGAARRMEAAKGAVLSLLLDAYQRRDLVAMVTFRDDRADVVLRPTSSVEVARARLTELPTGGRTPLAGGILTGVDVATAPARAGTHRPLLVVITDGRATSAPDPATDPLDAAEAAAALVRKKHISAVVIDAEDGPIRLGLAAQLAETMGARYLTIAELSPAAILV
jgi:magnesium chelatase subunit D